MEKAGLTRNEAIVYISLLKLGLTSAQNLIRDSELHRSRVYDCLESLETKGLASHVIKDYKRYFQGVSPEKLLEYVDEQKEGLRQILPNLQKMRGIKREEILASIYKGKEGLKTIHSELLREGKNIFVIGAKSLIFSELDHFMPNFERERLKKKMKWICLWDSGKAKLQVKDKKLVEGKVLPKQFRSNSVVTICGNKVAIVLWKERHPTGFMIENKDVADSLRKWFDLLHSSL